MYREMMTIIIIIIIIIYIWICIYIYMTSKEANNLLLRLIRALSKPGDLVTCPGVEENLDGSYWVMRGLLKSPHTSIHRSSRARYEVWFLLHQFSQLCFCLALLDRGSC